MPDENNNPQVVSKEKKGFFERLSLFQKVMIFLITAILLLIVVYFVFGGFKSVYDFFFIFIIISAIIFFIYIIIRAVGIILRPRFFSPKETYFAAVTNLAIDLKPDNVNDLYFEGDQNKRRVRAGKIIGVLGIPYLVGTPKFNSDGKPVLKDSKLLKRKIQVFEDINMAEDGDTLFIYESGFIFPRKHFLRVNRKLHGDIHGDVAVYDINSVPYGSWEYPYKQYQEQAPKIMLQTQLELILATHEHQGDYISQAVDAAMWWSPYMRLAQKSQAEFSGESSP